MPIAGGRGEDQSIGLSCSLADCNGLSVLLGVAGARLVFPEQMSSRAAVQVQGSKIKPQRAVSSLVTARAWRSAFSRALARAGRRTALQINGTCLALDRIGSDRRKKERRERHSSNVEEFMLVSVSSLRASPRQGTFAGSPKLAADRHCPEQRPVSPAQLRVWGRSVEWKK